MVTYVPLPDRFYGGMLKAFRTDHTEWKDSPDISMKYVKVEHDYIYYLKASAITAITTWVVMSATGLITADGAKLWADTVLWRAQQPNPPLEPAPQASKKTTVVQVLPGQLGLFD
jgi:hypothetical protein